MPAQPWHGSAAEDPRTTEELLDAALRGDSEDEDAWAAIRALHFRATREVLEAALRYTGAPDPRVRGRGADILAQLGVPDRAFPEECVAALVTLLATDGEPAVLAAAATALGHYRDARIVPALLAHRHHASEEVRFGVTFGLLGRDDDTAINALIELCEDRDTDVRNWATFGLGSQIDTDTPAIRDALLRRVTDLDDETRCEALLGLAARRDSRAIPHLLAELQRDCVSDLAVEAAGEIADPALLPALHALQSRGEDTRRELAATIAKCSAGLVGDC